MAEHLHPLASPPTDGGAVAWFRANPQRIWFLGLASVPGYLVPELGALKVFALLFLFAFWPFVAPLRPGDGDDEDEGTDPRAWLAEDDSNVAAKATISSLLQLVHPVILVASTRQMLGTLRAYLRYRGALPDPTNYDQAVDYRLPVAGEWTVVNGSPDRRHSHSWGIPSQRYAYDLVITDETGQSYPDERSGPEAHYCFGEPILAPADGRVVGTRRGHRDYHRTDGWLDPRQRDLRGNYVTIDHGDGEFTTLAHLQQGSVCVAQGDCVERGEWVGRCGHSGNSTEPHLHVQVQDRADFYSATGLPVQFTDVATRLPHPEADESAAAWERRDRAYLHVGQQVRHEPGTE